VKVSHRNSIGGVPASSEWVIMKPKRMRLEAYGVGFGECSDAVSTSRRAQRGKLISKQASAGEVKEQKTLIGLIIEELHVIGRGK
jgi:hypothetical protein